MLQLHNTAEFCNTDVFLKAPFLPRASEETAHNLFLFFKLLILTDCVNYATKWAQKLKTRKQWKLFNWTILKANLEVLKCLGLAEHKNLKNTVDG